MRQTGQMTVHKSLSRLFSLKLGCFKYTLKQLCKVDTSKSPGRKIRSAQMDKRDRFCTSWWLCGKRVKGHFRFFLPAQTGSTLTEILSFKSRPPFLKGFITLKRKKGGYADILILNMANTNGVSIYLGAAFFSVADGLAQPYQ